jgi:putative NADH-flavin reductase
MTLKKLESTKQRDSERLHVSAVLGHLQVISSFTINNNNKEKTYTVDKVLLRGTDISGVQRDLVVNGIFLVRAL